MLCIELLISLKININKSLHFIIIEIPILIKFKNLFTNFHLFKLMYNITKIVVLADIDRYIIFVFGVIIPVCIYS